MILLAGLAISAVVIRQKLPAIKGWYGERKVATALMRSLDSASYQIFNDVTLLLEDGSSTQIDHLVISPFGIFVIETKYMSGWIFGSEHQAQWYQQIYRAKYAFQNPLRQNYRHTKAIAEVTEQPEHLIHSFVVFTGAAELKTALPTNVGNIASLINFIKAKQMAVTELNDRSAICSAIESKRLTKGEKTNRAHVKYLQSQHSK